MALRWDTSHLALVCLAFAVSFLVAPATAVGKTGQVTVFWGRNKEEGTLRETCDTGRYTTVIISFYSVFGHGRYWVDLSGHPLPGVGDDIRHCQDKLGIPVFLSIGGPGDQYSLPTSQSATDVADNLFNAFFGGSRPGVFRPFGDVVLAGVDFFIDGWSDHYDDLANRFNEYNSHYHATLGILLSATPRCAYPDWRIEKALQTQLFQFINVRFYDDPRCSYNHAGLAGVMEQWNKWTAAYPNSNIYLGLQAANLPGKNDAVDGRALRYDVLPKLHKSGNYGGVMIWDRYLDKLTNYAQNLKYWA